MNSKASFANGVDEGAKMLSREQSMEMLEKNPQSRNIVCIDTYLDAYVYIYSYTQIHTCIHIYTYNGYIST